MSEKSEILYGRAEKAIKAVFSDTSVSKEETIRNLKTLKEEISAMIDSLEAQS